jgi:TonB-linked SusC/RagA family outer membrane protein
MRLRLLLVSSIVLFSYALMAQSRSVSGTVRDKTSGEVLPGVAVIVENANKGAYTDVGGKYTIEVADNNAVLVFNLVGYAVQKITVGAQSAIDVSLENDASLNEVVVTALGIPRDKKALGYASQRVSGEDVATAKETNVVNSLQGKVAGVQITGSSNLGGSSRILIRGAKSITNGNQPLFVVDGVPMDNSNFATTDQQRGALGYDYGNAAQDINPADIESVQILKGPAAALYGARGANGVILITTKKGRMRGADGKSPIGISINQSIGMGQVYVLPQYQNAYGGGYGDSYESALFPGQNTHDFTCDCSWGSKLDGAPTLQWYAYDQKYHPELYGKATPYEAHPDNVKDFFRRGTTSSTNVSLDGATENGSFRLSLNNLNQKGVVENSKLNRSTISFNGTQKFGDRITTGIGLNYVRTSVKGRAQTGYSNLSSNFTQWWQRQLDIDELRDYKNPDGQQRSWNRNSEDDPSPLYWNNPFWVLYENYETDQRDRIFGNVFATYKLTDDLSVKGTIMGDFYSDGRQERVAVGSLEQSKYSEDNIKFNENNYELQLNYKKDINEDNSLLVVLGSNRRDFKQTKLFSETLGGLLAPQWYSLDNAPATNSDLETLRKRVNSVFGLVSYGYKNFLYIDLTARNDWSSTLPSANNSYFYPSASTSFIYSEFIKSKVLSFGKIRLSWSKVGNDTDPYQLQTLPNIDNGFGSNGLFYMPASLKNPNLKPESISSWEIGTEANFFLDRIHVDFTYYSSTTKNNIMRVTQSSTSGYSTRVVNAGEIANKGIELMADVIAVRTKNGWQAGFGFNLGRNRSKVVELYTDENGNEIESIRLGTAPFAVFVEARPDKSYGQIVGYDYKYDANGNKLVDDDGYYMRSDKIVPLGSVLADFTGGTNFWVKYKGFKLYTLFDFQKGGSLYSLSNTWGKYSGTLEETAEGSIREDGVIVEGVHEDGTPNTTSISATNHFFQNQGYVIGKADVYDASFIKWRELRITYDFVPKMLDKTPFRGMTLGLTGRNLAILFKNVPHIDPEAGLSTGNVQGIEGGQMPTSRNISFFINLQF